MHRGSFEAALRESLRAGSHSVREIDVYLELFFSSHDKNVIEIKSLDAALITCTFFDAISTNVCEL